MKIRSFIIAYALVLAILLFADRRPSATLQDRYSHVVDLTDGQNSAPHAGAVESRTRIIAPGSLIPGTWAAGQIPAERLIAPLVVMDLNVAPIISMQTSSMQTNGTQISLDDISAWESKHGMIPQGAVVAIRQSVARGSAPANNLSTQPLTQFPVDTDAAEFLIDARSTIGFAVESPVNLTTDLTLARQLALHGSYVVEGIARLTSLPATGSLVIVAPAKDKKPGEAPVRILAMVK